MDAHTIQIRPATQSDREAIREVARDAWHDTYDELDSETVDETVDAWYDDETFASALDEPGTAVLVAEHDREVVGFAHGVVYEDEGDLLRMYVHPNHQREGIGTALHERLREDLEDFNMQRMQAIDLASNDASRRFYEGLGFERREEGAVEIGGEERQEAVYTLEL